MPASVAYMLKVNDAGGIGDCSSPCTFEVVQVGRRFVIILGTMVLIPVVLFLGLWGWMAASSVSSDIVDFHPTTFQAWANANFFYSLGDALKYSDEITVGAPTLLTSRIENYLVSPDSRKIAVVTNGKLFIVDRDAFVVRQVVNVDSIYRKPKPIGRTFFRDDDFEWSKDSRELYLIKDEFYESKGSQLFSAKGELWKYTLASGVSQLVLKPFAAYTYFFGRDSGIYFSVPTDKGDLGLKYFKGKAVADVGDVSARDIPIAELHNGLAETPFFSFSSREFDQLYTRGAALVADQSDKRQSLVIGTSSFLTLTRGEGFKGAFFCSNMHDSLFLPGNRYFLFYVPYCGNYGGQLLVDTVTGKYQKLPKDTRVYLTLDTNTFHQFRITGGGMMAN